MPVHRGCRPARRSLRRRVRRRVDRTLSQCFKWIARNIRWLLCVVLGCWASVSSLVPRQTGPTVTVPENEGKRCSKRARSSRPCLPDNFDALLECRDLTVDLMIEKMQTLLPVPTTYWHVCKHRLALTGQGGPLDLRAQQCRPLLACYLSREKHICWTSIRERWHCRRVSVA